MLSGAAERWCRSLRSRDSVGGKGRSYCLRVPAVALFGFWTMVAHYHGQLWNAAEPARALGVSPSTTRLHLDLLTDALVLRQLQPWYANLGKRQVKSPMSNPRYIGEIPLPTVLVKLTQAIESTLNQLVSANCSANCLRQQNQ